VKPRRPRPTQILESDINRGLAWTSRFDLPTFEQSMPLLDEVKGKIAFASFIDLATSASGKRTDKV
jgi:hypothetical protein